MKQERRNGDTSTLNTTSDTMTIYEDLDDIHLKSDALGLQDSSGPTPVPDGHDWQVWRSIGACGIICGVGLLGINRYVRRPVKRLYGRLGLGAIFLTWSFDKIVDLDIDRAIAEVKKDEDLIYPARCAVKFARAARIMWESNIMIEDSVLSYNKTKRTDEEIKLMQREGFDTLWIREEFRALAHYIYQGRLNEARVSAHDAHQCFFLFAAITSITYHEAVRRTLSLAGGFVTAIGILAPWPLAVHAAFYGSISCLGLWTVFGPVAWYPVLRCLYSFEDNARLRQALTTTTKKTVNGARTDSDPK